MGNKLRLGFTIEKTDTLYKSKIDSPDQGALGLPTSQTTFTGDTLTIEAAGLGVSYTGILRGDSLAGIFSQNGLRLPLVLKRTEKPLLNRPQTPQPPFPYKSEEVKFTNKKDNIELAATLTLPNSSGTFPAVILIAGSGPNDRDETILDHKPFLVIADYLTRNGIALLRYDKRGVGQSTGNFARATLHDFAQDARAAVDYLRTRNEIDKKRIGLLGHSEGGIVAPMVAAGNKRIGFIILMAAPGTPGIDIVMAQNEMTMRRQAIEPETIERLQKINREMFESLLTWENTENNRTQLRDRLSLLWEQLPILAKLKQKKDAFVRNQFNALILPGYLSFLQINAEEYLQKVSCPLFAINGQKDTQVPWEANLQGIQQALKKGGNVRCEIKSYPNLNHLFQECETGSASEYAKIEQTISPEVVSDITNWLKREINKIEK